MVILLGLQLAEILTQLLQLINHRLVVAPQKIQIIEVHQAIQQARIVQQTQLQIAKAIPVQHTILRYRQRREQTILRNPISRHAVVILRAELQHVRVIPQEHLL